MNKYNIYLGIGYKIIHIYYIRSRNKYKYDKYQIINNIIQIDVLRLCVIYMYTHARPYVSFFHG